jgi:23S rRNA (guanosine2251-2'-O)-methyltransferase
VIVYGRNAVQELIRAGRRPVRQLYAVRPEEWPTAYGPRPTAPAELEELCGSPDHQGIAAATTSYPYVEANELLTSDDALVVALDEVQDPHNLGAVARVCEVAGASGLVIPERRSAEVTPAACKASAGAVEHLPIARVRNLADFLGEAKAGGAWVYGAAAGADTSYDQPDYSGKVVLVLGAEGKGLRKRVADSCDALISLPVRGKIDSLNVSTAAAVLVYEILQTRR